LRRAVAIQTDFILLLRRHVEGPVLSGRL